MSSPPPPIPYPPIERHGVVGDRCTAALIAADGTVDWLCVPDYGGEPLFASLLDAEEGGYFRFGPVARRWGTQRYLEGTAVLETAFDLDEGTLVLHDAMILAPHALGHNEDRTHVLVRRLFARGGRWRCALAYSPRRQGARLWCSRGAVPREGLVFDLEPGEEAWAILAHGEHRDELAWTPERARAVLDETIAAWRDFAARLDCRGARKAAVLRSLLTIHLLGYAPRGSAVAAVATSLPERIGGCENYDYRLSWIRDGSLAIEALATHGDLASAQHYLDWLVGLHSSTETPLQVLYTVDGGTRPEEHFRHDLHGYRGSRPVRMGNRAWHQKQIGTAGFLADCILAYLEHGGRWHDAYFELLARVVDDTAAHWREPDNGIWELPLARRHVSSRVMAWVALDRAVKIAEHLGREQRARVWRETRGLIHTEVLEHGFSQRLGAFRYADDIDALDASTLLIPVMGFLPADDPRVTSTVDRIAEQLTIEGHVHRFLPGTISESEAPMGEFEGSFLLCTCWLATAYAFAGRRGLAEAALARVERLAGTTGLLSEGVDARSGALRGNFPLLFTHAEYLRAIRSVQGPERARRLHR